MKKYHIITYGCQMNKNDSEKIASLLDHAGYSETDQESLANLIIINTCSVRDKAERRVWGKLGDLKHRKKTDPELLVGVCGCMPQYQKEEILKAAPHVNLIFGTNTIHKLPDMLRSAVIGHCVMDVADNLDQTELDVAPKRSSSYQAWIPISFGCNNFCTYCIVPHTRGREKSRKKEDILNEIRQLTKPQYAKIVLLGQNVNSYGQDLDGNYDFADLLEEVAQLPGLTQVDFMTNHPKDISDKLIRVVKAYPIINKSLHIPIQAGDDEVLKKMNRHYTVAQYIQLIDKIRAEIPEIQISSDIIVGFPGESQEQFENTLSTVRRVKFDQVNTAAYSPRAHTPAATIPNQVPPQERARRLQELMRIIDETTKNR